MEENKEKKNRFTIDVPTDIHKKLKVLCAINDKSMRDLVIESMIEAIKKLEMGS